MIDEHVFFRQAVLRICGELKIEQAMAALLRNLSSIMPADRMFLQRFEREPGALLRTIVRSTPEESRTTNVSIPVSPEDERAMIQESEASSGVIIFKKPDKHPFTREMLLVHRASASSLMLMPLKADGEMIGNIVLLTGGRDAYTEEHARFFSLLKDPFLLVMSNAFRHHELLLLNDTLADDKQFLQDELRRMHGEDMIGVNFGLRTVMKDLRKVAPLDTPVLLLGESGVGKGTVANWLHRSSACAQGPFITVSCGAIPDSVFESELFGHEKGAFAGARSQKRGRFERASGGAVFLDEIAALPLSAQARVLRVLEENRIERVGGSETLAVNCRVIAATHRDLELMVRAGQFREDLWHRLADVPITIPPLRERTADIPALLQHFIREKVRELHLLKIPKIAPGVTDRLSDYDWPGNVREFANVIERELILNPKGPLTFPHFTSENPIQEAQPQRSRLEPQAQTQAQEQPQEQNSDLQQEQNDDSETSPVKSDTLDDVIRQHIQEVLQKTGGKIHGPGGAAELLDINANTLRNRMNKLEISYRRKDKLD